MIDGAGREIIGHDVIVLVLLQDLHVVEHIFARLELLNKPGAIVGAVAENLADQAVTRGARLRFLEKDSCGQGRRAARASN